MGEAEGCRDRSGPTQGAAGAGGRQGCVWGASWSSSSLASSPFLYKQHGRPPEGLVPHLFACRALRRAGHAGWQSDGVGTHSRQF